MSIPTLRPRKVTMLLGLCIQSWKHTQIHDNSDVSNVQCAVADSEILVGVFKVLGKHKEALVTHRELALSS